MTAQTLPATGYSRALALNGQSFAAGHYETAYHFLMAALHCAEDLGDARRLRDVAVLARNQRDALDLKSPNHRLATNSAHGGRSIFAIAGVMAEGVIQRLHAGQKFAECQSSVAPAELDGRANNNGQPARIT